MTYDYLENRLLTPNELHYAKQESQMAPYRMEPWDESVVLEWRYFPNFPVADIAESINADDGWDAAAWLAEELSHDEYGDGTGYRQSHIESLDSEGILDPVVIMKDSIGFDIGDGWHRIAWAYVNGVATIPAYVGFQV